MRKTRLVINKLLEEDSDVIVLTETSIVVDVPKSYPYSIKTSPYERTPNEHWVNIWSKWPIIKQFQTLDNHRTLCGIIKVPFGKIIIYGTIIPYHMAGVLGIRYGKLDY